MKKQTSGTATVYIFSGTKAIAEYVVGAAPASPTREYIYSGGQLVATIEGGATKYHHADHLSPRATTDSSGNILGEQGHYPYGESWYLTSTTTKWQFTSYERDAESGNDYAMARYHVNRLGRFSAPDPVGGSIADPQSLNRYAYVRNDPLNGVDPLGLLLLWISLEDEKGGGGGGFFLDSDELEANGFTLTRDDEGNIIDIVAPEGGFSFVDGNGRVLGSVGGYDNIEFEVASAAQTVTVSGNGSATYDTVLFPSPQNYPVGDKLPWASIGGNSSGSGSTTLDNRANALANALNKTGVQSLGNPCTVGAFYLASAAGGALTNAGVLTQATEAATTYWPQALSQGYSWLYRQTMRGGTVANFILNVPKNYNKAKAAVLGGCNAMQ